MAVKLPERQPVFMDFDDRKSGRTVTAIQQKMEIWQIIACHNKYLVV